MAHTVNRTTTASVTLPETYTPLVTGGSQGSVILLCRAIINGDIAAAGKVRLWINNGINRFLWKEMELIAFTTSTSLANYNIEVGGDGTSLSVSQTLEASTNVAGTVHIITTVHDA